MNRLSIACAGCLLAGFTSHALAQDRPAGYPSRPIRIIVPVLPGGGLDMICRAVGQTLSGNRWLSTTGPAAVR
jgi:tripartite-type tricarboxylate transporter receptor subunit TctC